MTAPRTPTDTFTDEALAFTRRHPDLTPQQQTFGGLAWGLMRAIAECPDCPGVIRTPRDNWRHLDCPACQKRWTREEAV